MQSMVNWRHRRSKTFGLFPFIKRTLSGEARQPKARISGCPKEYTHPGMHYGIPGWVLLPFQKASSLHGIFPIFPADFIKRFVKLLMFLIKWSFRSLFILDIEDA